MPLIRSLAFALATGLAAAPAAAAERIISVGGSVTEILYALGVGEQVVAVDSTSLYPEEARERPDVGYLRRLAVEPILAMAPDLVLASADAGPPIVLEQLATAGVTVVLVPDEPTVEGVREKIEAVAAAVGKAAEGKALADAVDADFRRLQTALATAPEQPRVLFLLTVSSGAPRAAGQDTAADGMIELAGGTNAVQGYDGYKPLSPEAALATEPYLVLIAEHSLTLLGGIEGLKARHDLGLLEAVREGRILVMDANLLLGFGPRAPEAARLLAETLHPDLDPGQ